MIDAAYHRTLALLQERKAEVEKLAQALLTREVLHKSDVEELIGIRPFEEKTTLEVTEAESFAPSETTVVDSAHADDMIDTAGTIVKAAGALKKRGATSVIACCSHPVLSGPAYDRIAKGALDELIVSDTIPVKSEAQKVTVLSTAHLFGEVIRRVYHNESVNSLFSI